MPSVILNLLT